MLFFSCIVLHLVSSYAYEVLSFILSLVWQKKVRVPAHLASGEYVLGWRWDCELTAQVWAACADITIVNENEEKGKLVPVQDIVV